MFDFWKDISKIQILLPETVFFIVPQKCNQSDLPVLPLGNPGLTEYPCCTSSIPAPDYTGILFAKFLEPSSNDSTVCRWRHDSSPARRESVLLFSAFSISP